LSLDWFDPPRLRRLRTALLRWYRANGRDLPWRRDRDPYRIWISEAMLQQTTVAAVKPYFERFLSQLPTVVDLANAKEEQILRLWEGLGYYSRARNLHKAAQVIVREHGGQFSVDVETLMSLPGVGRYTAGAVASFAFDTRAPIVEANTLRLDSRLLGYEGDPRSKAGQQLLWSFAETILPKENCGEFNHALMDLGAMVCRPADPDCPHCPLKTCCLAFAEGKQSSIPQKAKRPEITDVIDATVVVWSGDRVLIRRRSANERWAGMWDFPRLTLDVSSDVSDFLLDRTARRDLTTWLQEHAGLEVADWERLTELKHGVTRYRIRLVCFQAEAPPRSPTPPGDEFQWAKVSALAEMPFSMTGRKLCEIIKGRERSLFPNKPKA
jgi:A/G-specific adenine glycosylase